MASHRLLRVRELLKREIGEAIRREIPVEQAGLVTVNDVDVSGDLRVATVFIGILGSAEQQRTGLAMLQRNRSRIQGLVAKAVILKYTPQLRFVVDDSIARGNRVLDIIAELERTEKMTDD
ncbi:MAG: 30S ribosome-binding factor RbfA [Verrucomicrobia subdivision 3 bacterium]|nr:30S ribosome-binding factor RbfA [Limisphaerales bacterium]